MTTIKNDRYDSNIWHTYNNGNYKVDLYDDGTKVRFCEDKRVFHGNDLKPEFPESIDLKITNRCDIGCKWCHESSTKNGKHFTDIDWLIDFLGELPTGVEIAIGGGDPLSNSLIYRILHNLHQVGFVCNMTVGFDNLMKGREIFPCCSPYITALGISRAGIMAGNDDLIEGSIGMDKENIVYHFVAGIDNVWNVSKVAKEKNVLVLGYKDYGRGKKVKPNLGMWNYWIPTMMRDRYLSFDNLALEQLNISSWMGDSDSMFYMGDDGEFTMYVDAVTKTFAKNSTSERIPCGDKGIKECFKEVRKSRKNKGGRYGC